jgi:hypothetical protein
LLKERALKDMEGLMGVKWKGNVFMGFPAKYLLKEMIKKHDW